MSGQLASLSDIIHDRRPTDAGYERAVHRQRLTVRRRRLQLSFSESLYRSLGVAGWLSTTLLTTGGLFVALFLAAGNGTLEGFFKQVALLSVRYGEVDPAYRADFDTKLAITFSVALALAAFFRRAALINIFKTGGVDGPR